VTVQPTTNDYFTAGPDTGSNSFSGAYNDNEVIHLTSAAAADTSISSNAAGADEDEKPGNTTAATDHLLPMTFSRSNSSYVDSIHSAAATVPTGMLEDFLACQYYY